MQIPMTAQWEMGSRGDLSGKFIRTLQAAIPEQCPLTASLHRRVYTMVTLHYFFSCCLKPMPFVMYCAKLELLAVCWVRKIRAMDLCNASLRLLCENMECG